MSNYSSIHNHRSMFFDDIRNQYYFNAIKNVVNKDSVVLDLGAGLGLFGYMALMAGAKKVYLVEPAEIINTTRMIIKENNLSDKIECIEGKIEEIELPEKVDLIIVCLQEIFYYLKIFFLLCFMHVISFFLQKES